MDEQPQRSASLTAGIGDGVSGVGAAVSTVTRRVSDMWHVVSRRAAPITDTISPVGWSLVAVAVGGWFVGARLGWVEFRIVACAAMLLLLLCAILTVGKTILRVEVVLDPQRVVAGESAAGSVRVTNMARRRLLPLALELPIGQTSAEFRLPMLAREQDHEELFVVPTRRRSVIPVGPVKTVRGDPLGVLGRTVAWTDTTDLYVHPATVALEPLGSGLLRDLEGQTTRDVSVSDLAFHALRDYVPGDDRRHIHWRSSAKVGASIPGGKFLVRQFLDTRRSHLTVIVDGRSEAYGDPDDFEIAVSAAASVAVRAMRDEMDTTLIVADQVADDVEGQLLLDRCSAATFGSSRPLAALAAHGAMLAPDTSIALVVTGAATPYADLQHAASYFPPEVAAVGLRIDPATPVGMSSTTALTILNLPHLGDLGALMRGYGLR